MLYLVLTNQRRQKLMYLLKLLLVLIFLSLILPKIIYVLTGHELLGSYNKEENPTGNPVRVENRQEPEKVEEQGVLDGLVMQLHKFYRKDQ